jgi:sigma-B regulation protein RsbU (phosphoserine phosphatase)
MTTDPVPERIQRTASDLSQALDILATVSQDFALLAALDDTLRHALQRIMDYMNAEAASIFLLDSAGRELACPVCLGPVDVSQMRIRRGEGIVGRAVSTGRVQMVRDVRQDPDFDSLPDQATGFVTRSILCAPLRIKDNILGALEVINKKGGDGLFDPDDRSLLRALAALTALAIHNGRMAAALVEQERMQKELDLAREIQGRLLPAPAGADSFVHGFNLPVSEVSGDFFEHFVLGDGRVWFGVGDVSGKGMNAALLMAKTISLFRCLGKSESSPGRLLGVLNRELLETSYRGMFVTMAAGLYDPASDRLVLANAGHQPPLLRDPGGGYRELEAEDPPLGIVEAAEFAETRFALGGAGLYLFTDGLTEARLPAGPLGVEGVRRAIDSLAGLPPAERVAALGGSPDAAGAKRHDDVTVLLLERPGPDPWRMLLDRDFPADTAALADIRSAVRVACREAGCPPQGEEQVLLAVNEACMNVIQHGYRFLPGQALRLQLVERGPELTVRLLDRAPPVRETELRPRELDQLRPGGLGVHFMREVMDGVSCPAPPPGFTNLLQMTKKWK